MAAAKKQGFTLLEVVVSIGLLIMVFGGVTSLAILSAEAERSSKNNLIAAYLAKEAQDLVRNKRDANYLADLSPFNSIAVETDSTDYNFTINYDLTIASSATAEVSEVSPLDIVSNFYAQAAGTDTIFRRLVTTTYHDATDDYPARIDVLVEVYWKEDTRQNTYSLTSELTDWR